MWETVEGFFNEMVEEFLAWKGHSPMTSPPSSAHILADFLEENFPDVTKWACEMRLLIPAVKVEKRVCPDSMLLPEQVIYCFGEGPVCWLAHVEWYYGAMTGVKFKEEMPYRVSKYSPYFRKVDLDVVTRALNGTPQGLPGRSRP